MFYLFAEDGKREVFEKALLPRHDHTSFPKFKSLNFLFREKKEARSFVLVRKIDNEEGRELSVRFRCGTSVEELEEFEGKILAGV